ncbi:MAG: response regulator [Nitrospirae bacterium]|nr:response regulator [Candidatus Troglogloeales bacterium]
MNDIIEILLVEDNPLDVELTLRALQQHNLSNKVHWAKDGVEALEFLFPQEESNHNRHIRVVLLDLKLPKVNGLEVLERIRSEERTRTLPVVMLTSSGESPDVKKAYELGANSYIVKPIDFNNFSEVVAKLGFYWAIINRPPD